MTKIERDENGEIVDVETGDVVVNFDIMLEYVNIEDDYEAASVVAEVFGVDETVVEIDAVWSKGAQRSLRSMDAVGVLEGPTTEIEGTVLLTE